MTRHRSQAILEEEQEAASHCEIRVEHYRGLERFYVYVGGDWVATCNTRDEALVEKRNREAFHRSIQENRRAH